MERVLDRGTRDVGGKTDLADVLVGQGTHLAGLNAGAVSVVAEGDEAVLRFFG